MVASKNFGDFEINWCDYLLMLGINQKRVLNYESFTKEDGACCEFSLVRNF